MPAIFQPRIEKINNIATTSKLILILSDSNNKDD